RPRQSENCNGTLPETALGIAPKGHYCITLTSTQKTIRPCNVRTIADRLVIKSPLRQRAHSPLSPKPRPLYCIYRGDHDKPSNRDVLRYRSAASGSTTTIVF